MVDIPCSQSRSLRVHTPQTYLDCVNDFSLHIK